MKSLLLIFTVIAGALFPLQAGINARCGQALGHPLWATAVNFFGGAVFSLAVLAVVRPSVPSVERVAATPWWAWLGGLCGVSFVCISIVCVRPLGYLSMISGMLLGQVLASLLFDHTGFLRENAHPLTVSRIGGVALVAMGFWLVNRE